MMVEHLLRALLDAFREADVHPTDGIRYLAQDDGCGEGRVVLYNGGGAHRTSSNP